MTQTIKYFAVLVLGAALFAAFGIAVVAKANPSFFIRANQVVCGSFTATTSPTFLSVGTTTLTFDTSCASAGSADSATLLWQMTASTTNSVQDMVLEYSQDNVDWYYNELSTLSTTTSMLTINSLQTVRWQFASTSPAAAISPTSLSRGFRILTIPTPTRYVRASFFIPTLSATGIASSSAVWAEFVAKRQAN